MSEDDDLSEEQQRKMAAQLLSGTRREPPKREVRRSGNKRPEPVELRFVAQIDPSDGEWTCCEVEQLFPAGWSKIETFHTKADAQRAAESYRRSGDKVTWASRINGI